MMLSELINHVSRIWTPPAKVSGKLPTMIIPSIRDLRDARQAVKVKSQSQECAKLLAGCLYMWRKPFPEKSTLKTWSTESISFQGMDLDVFREYLMRHFSLRTDDNREWLLDRCIAAAIWNACIEDDSTLPLASWEIEMDRKQLAARK